MKRVGCYKYLLSSLFNANIMLMQAETKKLYCLRNWGKSDLHPYIYMQWTLHETYSHASEAKDAKYR
jgi:hypothetical protein